MKFTPVGDQVLVRLDPFDDNWDEGGLLARPNIGRDKPVWGTVIAAGQGRVTKKGVQIPVSVNIGDRVFVPWATGHDTAA